MTYEWLKAVHVLAAFGSIPAGSISPRSSFSWC